MDYQVIEPFPAAELIRAAGSKHNTTLSFNLSNVYELKNGSYLVVPLNPFSKSIMIFNEGFLDKCICEESFPILEPANEFYYQNKEQIDHLPTNKESIKKELLAFLKMNVDDRLLSVQDIDSIHEQLRRKNKFKKYRLHFVLLAGDFIARSNPDKEFIWALLKNKQMLNPIINLIFISKADKKTYVNIEELLDGKHGYRGIESSMMTVTEFSKRGNEIEEIVDAFSDQK